MSTSASLRKARVVPGIDPGTYVPLGMRTSDMSKEEMGLLLDLIAAFAAAPRRRLSRRGGRMRKIPPWVGTTDDAKIPLQVQLRILVKQHGRCAVTGHKFTPGDAKRLDHIKPLADGGLHGEANLQWILDIEHKAKTKAEAEVRARVRSVAVKRAGLERRHKGYIGRGGKSRSRRLRSAGTPEIMRRYQ